MPAATSQGGATTWSYTTLNQLQQEASARSGGYTQNFAYDSSGNPTTFKGTTQSFNSDNQQTGTGFAYDGNGSPTTYKGTTLTFDPENRMTGLGSSWSASYRADGFRASKTVSGTTTYYMYDGGEPVCEFNSSGTLIAYNVFAPDGLVARRKAAFPTWTEYTFDQQGNVAQRLDGSQSIITSSYYDAYGVENTTGTPTDQFGYNGQSGYFLDRETGLYLCQNRYFDPAGGRWITRDPIGYAGGINVYGYCGSGPIDATDTNGTNAISGAFLWVVDRSGSFARAGILWVVQFLSPTTPPDEILRATVPARPVPIGTLLDQGGTVGAQGGGEATQGLLTVEEMAARSAASRRAATEALAEVYRWFGESPAPRAFSLTADVGSSGAGDCLGAMGTIVAGADTLFQGAAQVIRERRRRAAALRTAMDSDDDPESGYQWEGTSKH